MSPLVCARPNQRRSMGRPAKSKWSVSGNERFGGVIRTDSTSLDHAPPSASTFSRQRVVISSLSISARQLAWPMMGTPGNSWLPQL